MPGGSAWPKSQSSLSTLSGTPSAVATGPAATRSTALPNPSSSRLPRPSSSKSRTSTSIVRRQAARRLRVFLPSDVYQTTLANAADFLAGMALWDQLLHCRLRASRGCGRRMPGRPPSHDSETQRPHLLARPSDPRGERSEVPRKATTVPRISVTAISRSIRRRPRGHPSPLPRRRRGRSLLPEAFDDNAVKRRRPGRQRPAIGGNRCAANRRSSASPPGDGVESNCFRPRARQARSRYASSGTKPPIRQK
jgi:hypothetical protein